MRSIALQRCAAPWTPQRQSPSLNPRLGARNRPARPWITRTSTRSLRCSTIKARTTSLSRRWCEPSNSGPMTSEAGGRERLLVLARTQAPDARFTEFLRAAPPLERKVAWDQAKAMLLNRIFEPFRVGNPQGVPRNERSWTLSNYLASGTRGPALGDMATCLDDTIKDPFQPDLRRWVARRFDWLLEPATIDQIRSIANARNKANHPQPIDDRAAEAASVSVRDLLARLCASSRRK